MNTSELVVCHIPAFMISFKVNFPAEVSVSEETVPPTHTLAFSIP